MANSLKPNEPSHQDLHSLHKYLFWSAGLKGLSDHWTGERFVVVHVHFLALVQIISFIVYNFTGC